MLDWWRSVMGSAEDDIGKKKAGPAIVWGTRFLVVLGASLATAAPVNAAGVTDTCLTGTAPIVANDLAQVNAARQVVQAACPGPAYAGVGRADGSGAYAACVAAAATGEFRAGRLRAQCLARVRSSETDSVYGYSRDVSPAVCLKEVIAGRNAGRVTCSIVPTTTATGRPVTRCRSTGTVSSQLCVGSTRCIDAGDSNLNGYLDAGDTGQCDNPGPTACQTVEDCAADGACPAVQGCTCSLTPQRKMCVPKCTTEAGCCSVAGGTASAPTDLASIVNAPGPCTVFVLADGYYAPTTITRSDITVRVASACSAHVKPELQIQAANVTVDGVSVAAAGVAVSVSKPGVRVANSCIQGFGKTTYGNGIWIYEEALDPANRIIIDNNRLDDWGGSMYSGGIAIGKEDDDYSFPTEISVEVRNNRITRGPTRRGIYNAAVQSFHPFLAYKNFVDTVSGTAFQNKTFNSRVACNEVVHNVGDGALYNRLASNNVWEYNLVHDSEVGIDHFMGDGTMFRGNVIYNVQYLGRVKDHDIGSTNVTFENNTFYGSTAWAGFIWDASSGGSISNVVWRRNVFHTINGVAIDTTAQLDPLWDEFENVFFAAARPAGTTGAATGSSVNLDPRLANPPTAFTVQEPAAAGRGAPWPPCP